MRHLAAYWVLRLLVGVAGLLTDGGVRRVGRWYGRVWATLDGRRRRMARRHMSRVCGPDTDLDRLARRVFESYGRYWLETLWIRASRVPIWLRKGKVEGLHHIEEARDAGTGMIYALPHMGNWEAAAPVSVAVGVPVVAVAENLANSKITDWFTKMRAACGIEIVLATGGTAVMRSLEEAIRSNKAVALPSDRDLKGRGVAVEFFGEMTTMPAGPATLALRTGAPLYPVCSYFEDQGHRVVVRDALPVPESGSKSEKIAQMTQALARHFEELIRVAPTQWHLVVPNWPSDREAG